MQQKREIRTGTVVVVVEGPEQGTEGTVTKVERVYDRDRGKMSRVVTIQPSYPKGESSEVQTRASWVRPS